MDYLEKIKELKGKASELRDDVTSRISESNLGSSIRRKVVEFKASDFVQNALELKDSVVFDVQDKIMELKESDIYSNGVAIKDAFSDAVDSFRSVSDAEYEEYLSKTSDADNTIISIEEGLFKALNANGFLCIKYDNVDKLRSIIDSYFSGIIDAEYEGKDIELYKTAIDPLSNSIKVFKLGNLVPDSVAFDKVIITCHDAYTARILMQELE